MDEDLKNTFKLAEFALEKGLKYLVVGTIQVQVSDQALALWLSKQLPEIKIDELDPEKKKDLEDKILFHSAN